jgi:hypothetical protein
MYRRVARIGAKAVQLNALRPNVGASLLAKAVCQTIFAVTDEPLSRAGSLPQGICVGLEKAQQGGDDGFGGVFLDEVAGVGNRVEL